MFNIKNIKLFMSVCPSVMSAQGRLIRHQALFFLILGLRIFFQNIKVGGGKKIIIKITKNFFLFNLKHIWIGEKKQTKIV